MNPAIVIIALTDPFVLATLFAIRELAGDVPDDARVLSAIETLIDMRLIEAYGSDDGAIVSVIITPQGWAVIETYNELTIEVGTARRELARKSHARIRGEFYEGREPGRWYQAAIDNSGLELDEWALRTAKEELAQPVLIRRVG